jgi:DNA (cytosine-5)-methyltransferase 1
MKLMSLFDGSGGFPLAASLCGIEPVYAAEVEPYPIAVTKNRFPKMKHLGDVSKVKGGEIEPVDIITFGSPCQDMSIAGKRAGLKHADIGDEETTRSGLFLEAIRIIKEWSIAYRVFDAQYWGVPQRRHRIYLVADFRGECAQEILFKRESLRGYFEAGRTPWQGIAADAQNCDR